MDLSHLPADTAFRFQAVARAIRRHLSAMPERPTLLDVGGHPGLFVREFTQAYPRWSGLTTDRPAGASGPYVRGSGTALPFRNGAFDVTVSLDTLEHIPPDGRRHFLVELCRCSAGHVILTAPFHHPATAAVERILDQAHRESFGRPHPWLSEHVEYGLPDLREVISQWPAGFGLLEVIPSYGLRAWLTWHALNLLRERNGGLDRHWEAWQHAYSPQPTPPPDPVSYSWLLVARRGAVTRPLSGMTFPDPEADADLPELARFYAHLLELLSGAAAEPDETLTSGLVNQRLKRALLAAEKELEAERRRTSAPGLRALFMEKWRRWLG